MLCVMDDASLFGDFFDAAPVALLVRDLEGRFVRVNDAACRTIGGTREELIGSSYRDFVDARTAAIIEGYDRQMIATGEPRVQRQAYGARGGIRYSQSAAFPLRGADGKIEHIGVVMVETTEEVQAEKRFRALSEHHPVAMLIARLEDNEVLLANPAFFAMIGLEGQSDPAMIARTRWLDSQEAHEEYRRLVVAHPDFDGFEGRLRHATAAPFWASVSWRRVDFDGEPSVVMSIVDISDKKEAEARLSDSEARLKAFLDHAPVAMYLKDRDDRYAVVNRFLCDVFGRRADEIVGMTPPQLLDPRAAAEAAEVDAIIRDTKKPHVREAEFDTPTGKRSSMTIRFPVFDAQGEIVYIGGVILDTTDTKEAEARLRESETRLNAFLHYAPMTMFLKDEEGRFLIMNETGGRQIGMPIEEVIGKTIEEISAQLAEAGAPHEKYVRETGQPVTVQQEYQLPHGRAVGLNTRFPVPNADGELTRVGGVFMDVTKQVVAEEELRQSRDALHQSEKMNALGSLLAGVSHELNNPLAIVVGEALMLEEEAAGGELADAAARIKKAAERCSRIVQTFLAMARQKEPQRVMADLNALVRGALELAGYGLRSDGIEVIDALDDSLPQLLADPDQIAQVFLNLIMNASQALQEQQGERRLTLRSAMVDGRARVEIEDNGPGVPSDIARRIFEPFFTTKSLGSGTGIGLSFSHGIAEAHGGSLRLVEAPGGGACFRLELPVEQSVQAGQEKTQVAEAMAGRRVLVVDDEAELADTLRRMLERDGMDVTVAIGGEAAIETLEQQAFDLILSDLRMPGVDGPGLYQWVSEHRPAMKNRFAIITGDILGPAATRFLGQVEIPVLEKPFSRAGLRELMARFS
ncbi:hybrid sensor histidine kinase/response regulator [Sphingomicrobium flavum]|uniref:hybrid sensor histidine kinase/response regulator n=1 Tax=Sphingomicrobium flavum TaxID=1229164 RepID=UPI0021AD67BF|nr:PAS domain S-box protein [Sphingomicrobium flavum]